MKTPTLRILDVWMTTRMAFLVTVSFLLVVYAAVVFFRASENGTPDAAEAAARADVERTIRGAVDAFNRQDAAGFLGFWTDDGLKAEFEASRAEIMAAADRFFGGPPRTLTSLSNTKVKGDLSSSQAEFTVGRSIEREKLELVRQGDAWKIKATDPVAVNVPSGTTTVDVSLEDFTFRYDPAKTKDGAIAFEAKNNGKQAHELVLLKVPESFDILRALQSPEMPLDVELIGGIAPKAPGDKGTMVFNGPLMAGRYLMVCFLPDTSDMQATPHVAKGMVSEFTIQAQGGNR